MVNNELSRRDFMLGVGAAGVAAVLGAGIKKYVPDLSPAVKAAAVAASGKEGIIQLPNITIVNKGGTKLTPDHLKTFTKIDATLARIQLPGPHEIGVYPSNDPNLVCPTDVGSYCPTGRAAAIIESDEVSGGFQMSVGVDYIDELTLTHEIGHAVIGAAGVRAVPRAVMQPFNIGMERSTLKALRTFPKINETEVPEVFYTETMKEAFRGKAQAFGREIWPAFMAELGISNAVKSSERIDVNTLRKVAQFQSANSVSGKFLSWVDSELTEQKLPKVMAAGVQIKPDVLGQYLMSGKCSLGPDDLGGAKKKADDFRPEFLAAVAGETFAETFAKHVTGNHQELTNFPVDMGRAIRDIAQTKFS